MTTHKTIYSAFMPAILAAVLSGCSNGDDGSESPMAHEHHDHVTASMEGTDMMDEMSETADTAGSGGTLYQCAMHPNIVDDEPGLCPICGMELQEVESINEEGITGRAPVRLTEQQRQLINIRLSPVETIRAIKSLEAPAIVQHDDSRVFTISAWTPGRIEKLHVNQEETYVEKGDVLYEIFSPNLYAAMQEYVSLSNGQLNQENLVESARVRLIQIGLHPEQIDELSHSGKAPISIPIKSPASGIVMKKMVREGQYVKEGDNLFTVVDLSELWLIAEVYEADLPFVSRGQKVVATSPAVPGELFVGSIELINHHIDPKTRTAKIRILFDNPEQTMRPGPAGEVHRHRLLPDMWMTARIERDLGQRLVIPRTALFDTGRRQYVFVESEEGVFVPTEIEVGPRIEDQLVVASGLDEGDLVVTDGVFLLDSESLLKASASGNLDADEAASDSAGTTNGTSSAPIAGLAEAANEALGAFWSAYLDLRASLASDSTKELPDQFAAVQDAAETLQAENLLPAVGKRLYLNSLDTIASRATFTDDGETDAARAQFGRLSQAVIEWAQRVPEAVTQELRIASCPMWTDSPAQWIQRGEHIENPFMGSAMLRCGTIEQALARGGEQ